MRMDWRLGGGGLDRFRYLNVSQSGVCKLPY